MRRSSIFLLVGAVLLGLMAVLGMKTVLNKGGGEAPQAPQTFIVVAAKPIKFGDKVTADVLKPVPWPGAAPEGAYTDVREAVADGNRTALREIKDGEPVLAVAVSGEIGRLASSSQLGPDMRAIAIPLTEVSGAGGFIAPGDRVDVLLTRNFGDKAAYVAPIVQGARVLAIGQSQDPSQAEPKIVNSATLEVTPGEAQKVALAQKVGELTLALRPTGDEARLPAQVASANEIFGMRPPVDGSVAADPAASGAAPSGPVQSRGEAASGVEVRVVRGTETTSYRVPR